MIAERRCRNCFAFSHEDRLCFNGVTVAAIGVNGQSVEHQNPQPGDFCQQHQTMEEFESESHAWERFGKAIGIY